MRRAVLLALAGAALLGGLAYVFLGGGPVVACRRAEGSVLRTVHVFESEGVNPAGKAGRVRQEVEITTTALAVVPRDRMTLKATVDRIVIEVFGDGPAPRLRMDTGVHMHPVQSRGDAVLGKVDLMKLGEQSTAVQGGLRGNWRQQDGADSRSAESAAPAAPR